MIQKVRGTIEQAERQSRCSLSRRNQLVVFPVELKPPAIAGVQNEAPPTTA